MGWEKRKGGLYYYRSRRVGGRVRKEYCGPGIFGQLAAEDDQAERAQREAERKAKREEITELVADPLTDYFAAVEHQVVRELVAAGYHRHRGEWRKART